MAKPKAWVPTSAEPALLVDLVTARMPPAVIAKRMGISELKLRRFEKRLLSARQATPPPAPPGQDMPAGGSWHVVWAKAGDHASRTKAANGRSVAVIRSPCPGRQSFAAGKPRIKIAFEACRRSGTFNHD